MSGRRVDSARLQTTDGLLGRITSILEAARGHVVRAVNHATVSAYWHIGREVVEALQRGDERAAYGKALIERLAQQLTGRYGQGFSANQSRLLSSVLPGVPRPNSPPAGWRIA